MRLRAAVAALAVLASGPGCLVEYAIGGATDSDDTGSDDSETCPEGQDVCGEGCAAPDACEGCPPDLVECDGECVAAELCDDGQVCLEGQIVCESGCVPDGSCCEAECDPVREVCEDGNCRCRDGLVRCDEVCIDLRSDPTYCGDCEQDCGDEGVCDEGECVEGCGDGRAFCDGACVVLASDPLHCDGCETTCASDELCLAGDCHPYTPAGECTTCPCPDDCTGDLAVCCDSTYLGAPVCVDDGCG